MDYLYRFNLRVKKFVTALQKAQYLELFVKMSKNMSPGSRKSSMQWLSDENH